MSAGAFDQRRAGIGETGAGHDDSGIVAADPRPIERFAGKIETADRRVLIEVTHLLAVTKDADVLRVAGPVKAVKLLRGEGGAKRVDQWLDVAFSRGGPQAKGELVATFDTTKSAWREVRSTLSLEWRGRVEGGSGRATFERKLRAVWE